MMCVCVFFADSSLTPDEEPAAFPQGEFFTMEHCSNKEQAVVVRRGRVDSKCGEKTGVNGGVHFTYIDIGRSEQHHSTQCCSASSSWKTDGVQRSVVSCVAHQTTLGCLLRLGSVVPRACQVQRFRLVVG